MARVASPGGVTTLSTTMTCLGRCPLTFPHPLCPRCLNTQPQRASAQSWPALLQPQLPVPPPPLPPLCPPQPSLSPTLTRHCPAKVLPLILLSRLCIRHPPFYWVLASCPQILVTVPYSLSWGYSHSSFTLQGVLFLHPLSVKITVPQFSSCETSLRVSYWAL